RNPPQTCRCPRACPCKNGRANCASAAWARAPPRRSRPEGSPRTHRAWRQRGNARPLRRWRYRYRAISRPATGAARTEPGTEPWSAARRIRPHLGPFDIRAEARNRTPVRTRVQRARASRLPSPKSRLARRTCHRARSPPHRDAERPTRSGESHRVDPRWNGPARAAAHHDGGAARETPQKRHAPNPPKDGSAGPFRLTFWETASRKPRFRRDGQETPQPHCESRRATHHEHSASWSPETLQPARAPTAPP